jgi:hypothetical protein
VTRREDITGTMSPGSAMIVSGQCVGNALSLENIKSIRRIS